MKRLAAEPSEARNSATSFLLIASAPLTTEPAVVLATLPALVSDDGVVVLGVLLNALNLLGVQANEQLIVRGAVVILAVILDTWNKKAKLKEVAK